MKIFIVSVGLMVLAAAACGGPEGLDEKLETRASALHGTAAFNFVKTADWGSGYNARVDITNVGSTAIQTWSAEFDMPKNVQVNVSGLPQCGPGVSGDCWQLFSDIGPENIVRIFRLDSSNVISVGQTESIYLYGSYEGVVRLSDALPRAALGYAGRLQRHRRDVTAPTRREQPAHLRHGLDAGGSVLGSGDGQRRRHRLHPSLRDAERARAWRSARCPRRRPSRARASRVS